MKKVLYIILTMILAGLVTCTSIKNNKPGEQPQKSPVEDNTQNSAQNINFRACSLGLEIINFNLIPGIEQYKDFINFLFAHKTHLEVYIPDYNWNYSYTKQELIDELEKGYALLDQDKEHPANQDLYLLKGIVCHCLYNLDAKLAFERALENFNHVDTIEERDYRYKWLLGNLYANALHPFEAIAQHTEILRYIPENLLHPLFWSDYAYAAFSAQMPVTAMHSLELFSQYDNIPLSNLSFYKNLEKNLPIPDATAEIDKVNLYRFYEREQGLGILARAFGIWIPIADESWEVNYSGYKGFKSYVALTPNAVEHATGGIISYTIMLFFDLSGTDLEESWTPSFKDCKLIDGAELLPVDFSPASKVYEYQDPTNYTEIGGAHGYLIIASASCPEKPGIKIEAPSKIQLESSDKAQYIALSKQYNRFPETVNYVFMLDTCNYIFEESKAVFTQFLKNVIIE